HPALTRYGLLRHIAIWLAIGSLIEGIVGQQPGRLLFPLFVGIVLLAKVLMVHTTLTMAEIGGAGLAIVGWGVLAFGGNLRNIVIALIFCGYVIAERLEPFQFCATAGSFSWVPFLGFMSSSFEGAVLSFLQKFFLFGSSIWLVVKAGLPLCLSIIVMAAGFFSPHFFHLFFAGRPAPVTPTTLAPPIPAPLSHAR